MKINFESESIHRFNLSWGDPEILGIYRSNPPKNTVVQKKPFRNIGKTFRKDITKKQFFFDEKYRPFE